VAELERNLIRERVASGLDKARRNGVRLGRPTVMNESMVSAVRLLREKGMTVRNISAHSRCGVGTVYTVMSAETNQKRVPAPA